MNSLRAIQRFAFAGLFILPFAVAGAQEIIVQNANFDAENELIIVKGKLKDFDAEVPVELYDGDLGTLLATSPLTDKQFSFKLGAPSGQTVSCTFEVRAGGLTAIAALRHAPDNCGQFRIGLSGVVRDDPIPFATVTVTIGGQTFTTVADENGEFFVEIVSTDLDALVTIESEDPADETTTMASIPGTLSKLVEDADENGVVDGTENPNINNTPFTTALFVAVVQANGGSVPTTQEELLAAETQVDATQIIQMAAVIKLIVDGGTPLPTDPATGQPYTTVLEFLGDTSVDASGNTELDNFVAANQADVDTAAQQVVTDAGLVPAFTEAEVPDRYYAIPATVPGFIARSGSLLEFDRAPNSGFFGGLDFSSLGTGQPASNAFDWSVSGGQLVLDFSADPILDTSFTFGAGNTLACTDPAFDATAAPGCTCADQTAAFGGNQVQLTTSTLQVAYTRVATIGATDFSRVQQSTVTEYDLLPGCPEPRILTFEAELRNADILAPIPFLSVALSGSKVAAQVFYDVGEINNFGNFIDLPRTVGADIVSLNATAGTCAAGWNSADTQFASQVVDNTFDLCWRVVPAGGGTQVEVSPGQFRQISREGDLEFDYGDGYIQVNRALRVLEPETGVYADFWNVNTLERFGNYANLTAVDAGFLLTAPFLENLPGTFWNGMLNATRRDQYTVNASGVLVPLFPFGWQFDAGGSGLVWFGNGGSAPLNSWSILAADLNFAGVFTYPAGAAQIVRSGVRNRFWIPLASRLVNDPVYEGASPGRKRMWVLESEIRSFGAGPQGLFISPRINVEEVASTTLVD